MATSSSSSKNVQEKYDVFISFRGEDTRNSFTSHLHAALERRKIKTFIDYQLKKGGEISPALEKAIEESTLSLVVFSKDYASSRWCLNELVKIIDCKKSHGQLIIPIFYHITPSEVRKQSGSFADAFSRHKRTERKEKVQNWKAALIDAAALAGWDSAVTRPESVLIDEIVKDVLKKLNYDSLPYIKGLVGIGSRVMEVKSLLNVDESSDVFCIGIWGMGGIGKTTIAEVVFNQISSQFEGRCFLENVKDKSREHDGLFSLREKLLSKLLDEDGIYLETLRTQCTYIRRRLCQRKVLVVLDDINDPEQFEILVGALDGFGPGSRIIVTSRDRQVLINCRVDEDKIYEVTKLSRLEALELFYRHAFKKNHPPYDLLELSDAAVNYAEGNPLALKILGSALQNKSSSYWKGTLNKLKQVPNPNIHKVLRISFDMLDDEQKNIFLDIVCFFNGDDMDHILEILASRYCSIDCGIEDLIDKSLITLSDNVLRSHDLLQEMGWKVVRDESLELGKRSRLWTEDACHVLIENSFEILVGALDGFGPGSRIIVTSRDRQVLINCRVDEDKIYEVTKLSRLEALELFYRHAFKKNHPPYDLLELSDAAVNYAEGNPLALKVLGSALQNKSSSYWKGTLNKLKQVPNPNIHKVLRISFDMLDDEQKNIFLDIVCFFNGDDMDHILEILASCYCSIDCGIEDLIDKSLITLSDNVLRSHDLLQEMGWKVVRDESLELGKRSRLWTEDACHVLIENSGTERIQSIFLDICEVGKIELGPVVFSRMSRLRLLKFFYSGIEKEPKLHLPEQGLESLPSELRYLHWEGYPLRSLPSNFNLHKLVEFSMPHSNLEHLWDGSTVLRELKRINLSYSKISSVVKLLPEVRCLTELDLSGTPIQEIPPSIACLHQLFSLSLEDCTALNDLPAAIRELDSLKYLFLSGCINLTKFPEIPENIRDLYLNSTAIEEVPSSIGSLSELVRLSILNCRSLKSLPSSICKMKSLEFLNFRLCSNLESFPETSEKMERLGVLDIGRTAIKSIPSSIENLINLGGLFMDGTAIKELPSSIENIVGLRFLDLSNSINLDKLPSTIQLTSLEKVYLCNCPTLTKLLDNLEDSNSEALSFLSSVRHLDLSRNNFERLPNLGRLSKLIALEIRYCKRLKSLPELPPSLHRLDAHDCTSLESVENFHFDWDGEYSLRFSNCFNLIQDVSSDDIVANAYRNIQLMATTNVERFNHHQVLSEKASVIFCLPTNEIPAWFNNQSIGSSIVVKIPPGWQNSQFSGFAFCVVVEFECVDYWTVEVDCYLKSSQGCSRGFRCSSWVGWSWDREADQPISDHVLLFYDHSIHAKIVEGDEGDSSRQNSLTEASFRFHLDSNTKGAKVKRCGVHLLYKNSTVEFPFNIFVSNEDHQLSQSLGIDEEEEDPQSRIFEEIGSSEMHRNPDFGGQMREYDGNSVRKNLQKKNFFIRL